MKTCELLVSALLMFSGAAGELDIRLTRLAQQGVPSQPGVPAKQPAPKSPVPTPSNQPQQPNPTTTPQQPTPATPGQQVPPVQVDPDNDQPARDPAQPVDPNQAVPPGAAPSVSAGSKYSRPFAFDHPDNNVRFTENARRLLVLEQKMERSNQDLMKRLGESRQLPAERQSAAMFEILQQLLKDQAEMQRYMVQARTAWSGDVDLPAPQVVQPSAGNPEDRRVRAPQDAPANNGAPR